LHGGVLQEALTAFGDQFSYVIVHACVEFFVCHFILRLNNDSAKGGKEIALKNPSAAGGEVTLNPAFNALSFDHGAIARASSSNQVCSLWTMTLRFTGIFCHAEFATVRQHYITNFQIMDSGFHFVSP